MSKQSKFGLGVEGVSFLQTEVFNSQSRFGLEAQNMPYYDTVNRVYERSMVIPTTGWTALRYGSENAGSRKYIGVFVRSPYRIYITTDNTSDAAHTRVIRQGGERIFPYSDKVTLYARSVTGGATVIVTEEVG